MFILFAIVPRDEQHQLPPTAYRAAPQETQVMNPRTVAWTDWMPGVTRSPPLQSFDVYSCHTAGKKRKGKERKARRTLDADVTGVSIFKI